MSVRGCYAEGWVQTCWGFFWGWSGWFIFIHSFIGWQVLYVFYLFCVVDWQVCLVVFQGPSLVGWGGCIGWLVQGGGVGFILLVFCEGLLIFLGAYCVVFGLLGLLGWYVLGSNLAAT